MNISIRRCAIYTRKSTEEGLDQVFNSLDAQRDACLAYIASQKSEGWTPIKEHYDDGGFSGGNMDRPAIQKLMEDIKVAKVNIVVVYKIDRLTRSLMDFAKLVEIFDAHSVTFVSVTQSFNTTTSMGRLTLNVLLSFAQFEREVAGERIRDKIAASKKKGMWMGGSVPLGYEVKDRALVINEKEAISVRQIYKRYLELDSVADLQAELTGASIKSKTGNSLSANVLYWLLQNPVYLGQVRHKGQIYDGQHKAIIEREMWDAVQQKLLSQTKGSARGKKKEEGGHLLQGVLFDDMGVVYSPIYTKKNKKRYPYYISRNVINKKLLSGGPSARLPAQEIEDFVETKIRDILDNTERLSDLLGIDHGDSYETLQLIAQKYQTSNKEEILKSALQRVVLAQDNISIYLKSEILHPLRSSRGDCKITASFKTRKSKRGAVVIRSCTLDEDPFNLPPHELRDLVRGTIWRGEHFNGMTIREIAKREGHSEVFVGRLIRDSLEIATEQDA